VGLTRRTRISLLGALIAVCGLGAYLAARRPAGDEYGAGPRVRQADSDPSTSPASSSPRVPLAGRGGAGVGVPAPPTEGARGEAGRRVVLVGRVVGEGRSPVSGASVRYLGKGSDGTSGTSGPEGRFRVEVAAPESDGSWIRGAIHATHEGRAALALVRTAARGDQDVDLGTVELQPAISVVARVIQAGKPAAGAHVILWASSDLEDGATALLGEAESATDGRATFPGVPPGWANLHARAKDGAVGRADRSIGADAPSESIEISVEPARAVDVTVVTDGDPGTPIGGADISCDMTLRLGENRLTVLPYVPPLMIPPSGPDGRTRIEGLVPGETLDLGASAKGFGWQRAEVEGAGRDVTFRLAAVQDVVFPLRAVDRPAPADGTSLEVLGLSHLGTGGPQARAVTRDGQIVVSDWQGAPAIAVAPSGDVAPLLEAGHGDATTGRETEFAAPRRLDLRFVDADGAPVPRVLASLWTSRFDRMFSASPVRRADAEGRVRFENLPPWSFTVHGFLTPSDDWGIELGEADVAAADATKEIVVGSERTVVVRPVVGGKHALPSGISVSFADAVVVASEEDGATGAVTLRVRPVDPAATEGRVGVGARGLRMASATFAWPKSGGSVAVDVPLGTEPDVTIEVRADPGASPHVRVERWNADKGWEDPLRWGSAPLIEVPGVSKIELGNGRYRLRDLPSCVVSEPFDVVEGAAPARVLLDVTGLVTVRGSIVGPSGPADDRARVVVEGPNVDTTTEYGSGLATRGGRFEARLPSGHAYELRAWHPVLRAAKEGGHARVDGPRDDVVLRLVEGPKVVARVLQPNGTPLSPDLANGHSLLVRSPTNPADEGKWFEVDGAADGALSASGLPTGPAEIWLDFEGFAPLRRPAIQIAEGTTDLGEIRLEEGSAVTLRFPEKEGKIENLWGEAELEMTPSFSREAIASDTEPTARFIGLCAGRWKLALSWTDRKGESREFAGSVTVDGRTDVTVDVGAK
jgi:hypothetical protein